MKDPETVDTTAAMKRPRKARMMDCGIGGGVKKSFDRR